MSSVFGAVLLTISLSGSAGDAGKLTLPNPVIEAGLKKAHCTVPPGDAEIVGTERLSSGLEIIEVTCWRSATNTGSILFGVPERRPQDAQLLPVESWQNGRVRTGYSVSAPGFDAKTRTISSSHKARPAGDCGTTQEMKWTGWHFRLLNVWTKDSCDGEPFEWDSRHRWQVFPRRGLEAEPDGPVLSESYMEASR